MREFLPPFFFSLFSLNFFVIGQMVEVGESRIMTELLNRCTATPLKKCEVGFAVMTKIALVQDY